MANPKHLAVLRQGVEAWNRWRAEHPDVTPDLSEANLRALELKGVNLRQADLRDADLRAVNLEGADLSEAKLNGANLGYLWFDTGDTRVLQPDMYLTDGSVLDHNFEGDADIKIANLRSSNLREAWMYGANLSFANLDAADLTEANLTDANLTATDLAGARFDRALVGGTIFAETFLNGVTGLDTVTHTSSSHIDMKTILKSKTDAARAFLRAAGAAQATLDHFATLSAQFHSCFISYSERDRSFAERLHGDLQKTGVQCWFAPEDLKIGAKLRVSIDESIRAHNKLLLVLSKHSVASQWVEKEVETAMEREQKQNETILYPIRLDDTVMKIENGWPADIRRTRNIGDFRKWRDESSYTKAFERLVRDLRG